MNHSTENVTLWATFVLDVLREVENLNSLADTQALKDMVAPYNIEDPFEMLPMQLYNDLCNWVEENMGEAATIRLGFAIGETVYNSLSENSIIDENSTPREIIDGLIIAAESMIDDPENRGWNILESTSNSLIMQRTQTFNSKLQFGLLEGLIQKSEVTEVKVSYLKEVAKGEEFDEYLVTWTNPTA